MSDYWQDNIRLRKDVQQLRTALTNSDNLLRVLGTPDDPVVQTALAENAKALNKTDEE